MDNEAIKKAEGNIKTAYEELNRSLPNKFELQTFLGEMLKVAELYKLRNHEAVEPLLQKMQEIIVSIDIDDKRANIHMSINNLMLLMGNKNV